MITINCSNHNNNNNDDISSQYSAKKSKYALAKVPSRTSPKFWYGDQLYIQPADDWQMPYKEFQPKKKRKLNKMNNCYFYNNNNMAYNINYHHYYTQYFNANPLYPALKHYYHQTYERFRTAKDVGETVVVKVDDGSSTQQLAGSTTYTNLVDQLLRSKRNRKRKKNNGKQDKKPKELQQMLSDAKVVSAGS